MTFLEYLATKKIDASKFEKNEKDRFDDFNIIFDQVHPNSFTQQKLFFINVLRRRYPIPIEKETVSAKKPAAKPVFRKKPSS